VDVLNRCALVLRLPNELASALGETQIQVRKRAGGDLVRWTPTSELVLTLSSLGEISAGQIVQVDQTIGPIIQRCGRMNFLVDSLGGSPTNLQPRFVWAGVGGDIEPLKQLNGEIERALSPILRNHEVKEFEARIPLGRIKQESESTRSALGRALRVAGVGEIGKFCAEAVCLVRYAGTSMGVTILDVNRYVLGSS
jgi:2'-5' RNA ligase